MTWLLVVFLSGTVQESVYFSDLDSFLELQRKLEHKTTIHHSQETVKSGSKLIVYLKQYLKRKDNEDPKYLQGKKK